MNDEPAGSVVDEVLNEAADGGTDAMINRINAVEVYYILWKRRAPEFAKTFKERLTMMPLEIIECSQDLLWSAAGLKARYPISLADACAGATALSTGSELFTGDPDFQHLEAREKLSVRWLS